MNRLIRRITAANAAAVNAVSVWLLPSNTVAYSDRYSICGDGEQFASCRLGGIQEENLREVYWGTVGLLVKAASRCTFTDQYPGLNWLNSDCKACENDTWFRCLGARLTFTACLLLTVCWLSAVTMV